MERHGSALAGVGARGRNGHDRGGAPGTTGFAAVAIVSLFLALRVVEAGR